MNTRIAAVPLLAAIGFGAPAFAQEPEPQVPVARSAEDARTGAPRMAKPRPPSEPVRADEPARVEVPPPPSGPTVDRSNPDVYAQRRGGGGGRRGDGDGSARGDRGRGGQPGPVYVRPVYPSPWGARGWYGRPYRYDPWWNYGAFGWSPLAYAPWSLMWGTSGYWGYPWPGGPGGSSTFDTGGVRLKVRPRDAQVYVDGNYAGLVDDFDGTFQSLRLAPGGHKIELRMPGYDTLTFDVYIQPDRTLTLKDDLKTTP